MQPEKIHSQLNVVGFLFFFVLCPPATVLCTLIPRVFQSHVNEPLHSRHYPPASPFPKNRWQDPRGSFVVFWAFCVFSLEMEFKCLEGHPACKCIFALNLWWWRMQDLFGFVLLALKPGVSTHLGVFAIKLNTLTRGSIDKWFLWF